MFSSQKETITQNKSNVISKQMEIGTGCEYISQVIKKQKKNRWKTTTTKKKQTTVIHCQTVWTDHARS